ncbi:MAG TPA: glycosyltransferase family 2 protein [Mycobacterium sp.]
MSSELVVVIVTYNSVAMIETLLDSLPAALGDVEAEIVVVDNGSSDGTQSAINERGGCKLVESTNLGYAAGINRGVAEATDAGAILILNPDVRMTPGAVPALLARLCEHDIGIVAPRTEYPDGRLEHSLRREPTLLRSLGLSRTRRAIFSENVNRPEEYAETRIVDWAVGAALLVSRECFDAVGGWDESFFLYSEETDFCLRARDLGYLTVYEPQALVIHYGGGSGRSGKTFAMHEVNRVRLYRRRHGTIASLVFLLLSAARDVFRMLKGDRAEYAVALRALLCPSRRPVELGASGRLLPD